MLRCLTAYLLLRVWLPESVSTLCQMSEEGRQRAAAEASAVVAELMAPMQPATLFGGFFPEVEEEELTTLRLWPRQLPDV